MDQFQNNEPTENEMMLVARSYAMRQEYWPAYTWHLQTEYFNKIDEKREALEKKGVDIDTFTKRKSDLFNKINASFYHLQKVKENENTIIALGKKLAEESQKHTPKGVAGVVGMPYEPIDYEYEALLVTLKSTLDIMAMILSQPSNLNSDNIVSLLNDSQQAKQPCEFLTSVRALLTKDEHAKTIDEFRNKDGIHSKRNYAVHQGSLPTGTINIQFTPESAEISIIKTSTMNVEGETTSLREQQNLDDYVSDLFYAVCDLIIEGLELLADEQLPKGKKTSVYKARLNK